jgi:twitching motility protein PilT
MEVVEIENKKIFGIGAFFSDIAETDRETIKKLVDRYDVAKILKLAISKKASDLHLIANQPIALRINGQLEFLGADILSPDQIYKMIFSLMSKQQVKKFEQNKEMDLGSQFDEEHRFRINVHQQKGFVEAALRLVNSKMPTFKDLNVPDVVQTLARQKDGLVLVTGPTGSGKSTTIAAMVDQINHERKAVLITLERPIEYVHINDKCVIKQREVGTDTASFSVAIKSSLRQDPNIIVVGELDDAETVKTALIAAEAGYLVIASFHAPDTIQAIDRLANILPLENRKQTLSQLSHCLRGIVTQMLIPRCDKNERILVTERLIATDAVKRIIRRDELFQLTNTMQTGAAFGMKVFSDSLKMYFEQGIISGETYDWYSHELSK